MKIALFFILVAVSSCFAVDAQLPALDGKGRLTNDQIDLIALQFVGLVKLYVQAQKSGDPCQKQCVLEKILSLVDQLAIYTNCHHQIIVIIAVSCLPAECKDVAGKIGDCLMTRDAAAMMKVNPNICAHLITALMSTWNVLLIPLNVDIVIAVTNAVLSLARWCTPEEIDAVMRCVAKLGCLAQGVVLQVVGGVLCLVHGTVIKPVGEGLKLINDVSIVKAILGNLGCSSGIIDIILSIAGAVGGIIGGLVAGLLKATGGILGGLFGGVSGSLSSVISSLPIRNANVADALSSVTTIVSALTGTLSGLTGGDNAGLLSPVTGAVSGLGSTLGAVTGAANNIVGGLAGNTVTNALGTLTRPLGLGNIL